MDLIVTATHGRHGLDRFLLGSISHALGRRKINIHNMLNKSKGEMAYTLVDADSPVPSEVTRELGGLNGVLSVRYLPVDG